MVLRCSPSHMRQRRLPADDFADGIVDEGGILFKLLTLVLKAVQTVSIARHRVACRVVATND